MALIRAILTVTVVLTTVVALGCAYFVFDYLQYLERPLSNEERVYSLDKGSSLRSVADELTRQGVLEEPYRFIALGRIENWAHRLRAGEYLIPAGLKPRELLELLASGKVVQYQFTILEGWSFRDLRAGMMSHPRLEQTLTARSDQEIMALLDSPALHPEGRFFPDTYFFEAGTTDLQLLRRAKGVMARQLSQLWPDRQAGLPLKSPDEALILASIIEKETGAAHERATISAVFINRLRKGMKLQTDPTVIYGLGDKFDGNLRRRDLRTDTPYNTYVRFGLPPTPIAMPGLAAIEAALHPVESEKLFFVAKGDGTHYFSETYAEHRRAVRRYQLGQ